MRARQLYQQGRAHYVNEAYDEAIERFLAAYACLPNAALLYNLGQAYRLAGKDCKALSAYREYLASDDVADERREEIEGYIGQLIDTCEPPQRTCSCPTPIPCPPPPPPPPPPPQPQSPTQPQPPTASSSRFIATLGLGTSLLGIGELDIHGAQPMLDISAGIPITSGRMTVSLGGLFTYTPLPWNNGMGETGTSSLTGVMVDLGTRVRVLDSLSLRMQFSVGGLLLTGLSRGNVFMPDNQYTDSPLVMPSTRVSLGVEYDLTRRIMLTLVPLAFSYTRAVEGMRPELGTITRFDMVAGIGFHL